MIVRVFGVMFLIMSFLCHAHGQQVLSNKGLWLMYNGDNKINTKIGVHSEVQVRNFFLANSFEQSIVRTGLHYYISPFVTVTGGYANVHTRPGEGVVGASTNENRCWQQLILRFKTKGVFLEHRYRLEQRWTKNLTNNTSSYDDRIRYRFQSIFPLYTISPTLRHLFVLGSNEVFVNYSRNVAAELFDRNRLFFSVGYQVSPKLNFQIGYLHQSIQARHLVPLDINHNLQVSIAYNMDDLMGTIFGK
jgi:hypothetical protein